MAYYAMFHSAKAVLFRIGLREKAHFVIGDILEILSKEGKLESYFADYFRAALSARTDADYHYEYSKKSANELIEMADEFMKRMHSLLKELKSFKLID
jgi:uncharacterized protein (UPF0332 family)